MAHPHAAMAARLAFALVLLNACTETPVTSPEGATTGSIGMTVNAVGNDFTMRVRQHVGLTTTLPGTTQWPVIWTSSDPSVASVTSTGIVYGERTGTAIIKAWLNHDEEVSTVTVIAEDAPETDTTGTPNAGPVASIRLVAKSSLIVGEQAQATAAPLDANGQPVTGLQLTWTTSAPDIAAVSSTGTIAGLRVGNAEISVSGGGKSAAVGVQVTLAPVSETPAPSGSAELPRSYVDTRYPSSSGRTIVVNPGGDLQGALNIAQRGDVVLLTAGATYTGTFTLPAKPGSVSDGWIVVRTSAPDGTLPFPGSRVAPKNGTALARIVTPDYQPAIRVAPGASGWRLTGLEVTVSPSFTGDQYGLVFLGEGNESSEGQLARDLVLDRSWVHGQWSTELARCISMNGIRVAVIDSWVAECHARNNDSQAIAGWNGPGPIKIANNYLEGTGENLIFGGADPGIYGLVPSDIEIVGNHVIKPLSWKGGPWQVKNLLELKNAQRVLVEGNVFQNSWTAAQDGWAFIWASLNQDGGSWGSWSVVRDVTFRYNRVDNVEGGFNLAERYDGSAQSSARFTITHNLITNVGFADSGELDRLFVMSGQLADVAIEHNTGFAPTAYLQFGDVAATPKPRLTFRNNLGGNARYTYNSPLGDGAAMFTAYGVPLSNVVGNCIVTTEGNIMPPGNTYPSSLAQAALTTLTGLLGDFGLTSSSPCAGKATDGTNPGADSRIVMSKTAGAVVTP